MEYVIRSIKLSEFREIYNHIENDFPPEEYAPYNALYQQLKAGIQKGYILLEGERELAYYICAEGLKKDYVLISLLAVYKEFRGKGIGSRLLEELKSIYSDKKGIIVEVEKPQDMTTDKEKAISEKRIQFYEKAGFYLIPDIDYSIWDVPMHLMAVPLKTPRETINQEIGQIIYDIYLALLGERFIHKLKLIKG